MQFFATVSLSDMNSLQEVRFTSLYRRSSNMRQEYCNLYVTMLRLRHVRTGTEISKKLTSNPRLSANIQHFFFSHKWGTRLKYLPKLCPYILMYSALHIMQWFSHILGVFTRKSNENVSIFTFYESKQMSLTHDLSSLGRSIALQLQRQTDLLLCTINCFLQWDHLPQWPSAI